MASTRRLFIGLPPPIQVAEALHAAAFGSFAPHDTGDLRFTAARDLHLTLLFLGDVGESAIPGLSGCLERGLKDRGALDLEIDGTGAFPSPSRPRVLWAGVKAAHEEGGGLEELREEVVRSVREAGVAFSARETDGPFRAHITLARVRSRLKGSASNAFFELAFRIPWRADEVVLFQSGELAGEERGTTGPGVGPRYPRLQRVPLMERS